MGSRLLLLVVVFRLVAAADAAAGPETHPCLQLAWQAGSLRLPSAAAPPLPAAKDGSLSASTMLVGWEKYSSVPEGLILLHCVGRQQVVQQRSGEGHCQAPGALRAL